jgi:hypothetical protein
VVADLTDGSHVDGVVELTVPAAGEAMDVALPAGASIGAVPLQAAK